MVSTDVRRQCSMRSATGILKIPGKDLKEKVLVKKKVQGLVYEDENQVVREATLKVESCAAHEDLGG